MDEWEIALLAFAALIGISLLGEVLQKLGNFIKNTFWGGAQVAKEREEFERTKKEYLKKERENFEREKSLFAEEREEFEAESLKLAEREKKIENDLKIISHKTIIIEETAQNHPEYATLIMRYNEALDTYRQARLSDRAYRAKEIVSEIKREKKCLIMKNEMYFSQLLTYETLFPWLEEFKEIPTDEARDYVLNFNNSNTDEQEYFRNWLSPEEFSKLTKTEKLQRKFDKWKNRKKSDWEAGIEYERCIGYLCEQDGYTVNYSGALNGLEDMGRDLIATKDNSAVVIQCKRWKKDKQIHEKHIFQLFGTSILYEIQNPRKKVTAAFVTTGKLSDTAQQCADKLNIKIVQQNIVDYPLIKCNINRTTNEKIYHLPFDQQYDRVVVETSKGECYVFTVTEAENLGFRHALKHFST